MPESRKRVKKTQNETAPVYRNPLKSTWGKVTVLILAIAFILGLVATTAVVVWLAVFGS